MWLFTISLTGLIDECINHDGQLVCRSTHDRFTCGFRQLSQSNANETMNKIKTTVFNPKKQVNLIDICTMNWMRTGSDRSFPLGASSFFRCSSAGRSRRTSSVSNGIFLRSCWYFLSNGSRYIWCLMTIWFSKWLSPWMAAASLVCVQARV